MSASSGVGSAATPRVIAYAWSALAARAGAHPARDAAGGTDVCEVPFHYCQPDRVPEGDAGIIVVPASGDDWLRLLSRAENDLDWADINEMSPRGVRPFSEERLPVVFRGEGTHGRSPIEQRSNGSVVFNVDIIATTIFMLTRWEETVIAARDRHDRFPASASVALRQGFLDRPIVDEYALVLREWIRLLRPGWIPGVRESSVRLSHDIDRVALLGSVRQKVSALLRPGFRKTYGLRLRDVIRAVRIDPFIEGINRLASLSRGADLRSSFFFMAAEPSQFDSGYDPAAPRVRECMRSLLAQGFEVGFHPGYHTLGDVGRLSSEKERLEAAIGHECRGGRQHVLRFSVPQTWRDWANVGLDYDCTLGFADHEGFRCGTCHPFQPYDLTTDSPIGLLEIPLIAMDTTLKEYRALSVEDAERTIIALANRCRAVGGDFTLLWHNTSFFGEWCRWGRMYERLIACGFGAQAFPSVNG